VVLMQQMHNQDVLTECMMADGVLLVFAVVHDFD
jgi:hypothetical protein